MPLNDAVAATQEYIQQIKAGGAGLPTIAREYGAGDVYAWIPSGIFVVDQMLGGGLPLGRISELFSVEESEGKTTLALHFAISCQSQGGIVIWLESESALDKGRAARMGLNLDAAVVWGPPDLESGFAFIKNMMANIREQEDLQDVPVLVVWDTIAAALPKTQKEGDMYGEGMNIKPRVIFAACKDLTIEFFKHKVHMLFVNQSITTMSRFGSGITTPGGKGIKFHASIRIQLHRRGSSIEDENGEPMGITTEIFVKKNKLALPHRKGSLVIHGEMGFQDTDTMFGFLHEKEMTDTLRSSGGWWKSPNADTGEIESFRATEVYELAKTRPGVVKAWRLAIERLYPLPVDRKRDPFSGWVFPDKEYDPARIAPVNTTTGEIKEGHNLPVAVLPEMTAAEKAEQEAASEESEEEDEDEEGDE